MRICQQDRTEQLYAFRRADTVNMRRKVIYSNALVPDWLLWACQKLLIYWDLPTQPSLRFTKNGPKKEKLSREQQFAGSSVNTEESCYFADVQTMHLNAEERWLKWLWVPQGVLSISEIADLLRFSHQTISELVWKKEIIQRAAVLWEKMLMLEENGQTASSW